MCSKLQKLEPVLPIIIGVNIRRSSAKKKFSLDLCFVVEDVLFYNLKNYDDLVYHPETLAFWTLPNVKNSK
jgi:hypothetical protein